MASLIGIPARTPASRCRSCNAWVYWVTMRSDKKLPVSIDRSNPEHGHPTYTTTGHGQAHFADCPHADRWRKKKVAK